MAEPPAPIDLAARLRALTQARIALGRTGQSLTTTSLLDFELAHARARDAVHARLDANALRDAIDGQDVVEVHSLASDRATYLQRPDLGRLLDPADAALLGPSNAGVAIVIGDGLSATAVQRHAGPLVVALIARLANWSIAPIVLAHQARVALGDEIGAALVVDLVIMLIGERPGLSAPDSLGAYLTWAPCPGRRDSERNCVSNIRPPHGLGYAVAAERIAWLAEQARTLRLTGTQLKDESPAGVRASQLPYGR